MHSDRITPGLRAAQLALGMLAGCGGQTEVTQLQPAQANGLGPTAAVAPSSTGNAPALVVDMSMEIPKKPIVPPVTTAPATRPAAGAGAPPMIGAANGMLPPGAAMPVGTAPAAPGAAAAGAAAPSMDAAAGAAAPADSSAAGADISGVPEAELAMLRELCVSTINMYRATLTDKMLTPLKRATPEQEECSQRGAKMDGDTMSAHGAARAGLCSSVGLSAENTCPGYPVGGFGGGSTIADALMTCLTQMWAEGEPPVSRQECQQDYQGCFLKHGHYLNMSDPSLGSVACSFYKMSDGRSYWMNQDFAFAGGFGGWGMR